MKFSLVHLSGCHRGKTEYFDRTWLTLGSDPKNDVSFPAADKSAVAPLHAELFEERCELHLRNRAAKAPTLVNHLPIDETVLHDSDLLQLGSQGPKVRIRIRPEEYAACKLVREIMQDARDIAAESDPGRGGRVSSFVKQLAYDLRTHATRTAQVVLLALFVGLSAVLVALAYYSYVTQQAYERQQILVAKTLEAANERHADLEQTTAAERVRLTEQLAAHEAEMRRLSAARDAQRATGASPHEVQALTRRLQTLETERTRAESLITQYGPAVCLLYGTYGFLEPGASPEATPAVLLDYMGTGFLVEGSGTFVTNRHLVEPWSMNKHSAEMIAEGLQPKLMTLFAHCPSHAAPFAVSLVRASDQADLAIGRLSPPPTGMPTIPLTRLSTPSAAGEPVMVLGYPTGVEGLLARMEDPVAVGLIQQARNDLGRLVGLIAREGRIWPLATQGHLADVVPNRMLYDAQTTGGGSGSPVFDRNGALIAIHSATMTRFGAVSFGVPVERLRDLIPTHRSAPSSPSNS